MCQGNGKKCEERLKCIRYDDGRVMVNYVGEQGGQRRVHGVQPGTNLRVGGGPFLAQQQQLAGVQGI